MLTKTEATPIDVILDFHLNDGEAITSASSTVTPSGTLEVSTIVANRDDLRVVLREGEEDQTYTVTVIVGTSHSRSFTKTLTVEVVESYELPRSNTDPLDGLVNEIAARSEADESLGNIIENHLDTQTIAMIQMATNMINLQTMMVERFAFK